jgi:hypothetical protein
MLSSWLNKITYTLEKISDMSSSSSNKITYILSKIKSRRKLVETPRNSLGKITYKLKEKHG